MARIKKLYSFRVETGELLTKIFSDLKTVGNKNESALVEDLLTNNILSEDPYKRTLISLMYNKGINECLKKFYMGNILSSGGYRRTDCKGFAKFSFEYIIESNINFPVNKNIRTYCDSLISTFSLNYKTEFNNISDVLLFILNVWNTIKESDITYTVLFECHNLIGTWETEISDTSLERVELRNLILGIE